MGTKTTYKSKYTVQVNQQPSADVGTETVLTTYYATPLVCTFAHAGVDDPLWESKVKKGLSASNAFSASKQEVLFVKGSAEAVILRNWGAKGTHFFSEYLGVYPFKHTELPSASDLTAANSRALTRLYKKIRSTQASYEGLTFIGEAHQALSMIKSPLKAIRYKTGLLLNLQQRVLRDKTIRRGKMPSWEKSVSEAWLEYSYGVAPLMSDISGILEASLNKFQDASIKRISVTDFADSSDVTPFNIGVGIGWPMTCRYDIHKIGHSSVQYSVGVRMKSFNTSNAWEAAINGGRFNLAEIIPTAWELIPWSFLIDYFTNVGDVLASRFGASADVAWINRVDKRQLSHYYWLKTITNENPSAIGLLGYTPHRLVSTYTSISRSAPAVLGFPSLSLELPGRAVQFLNMAALLRARGT